MSADLSSSQWINPAFLPGADPTLAKSSAKPGLLLSIPATSSTRLRISLYLHHTPDRFALVPQLARMLDCQQAERGEVLAKLWGYVKANGLVLEGAGGGSGGVRCEGPMRELFSNQGSVPFHHLPEYVNRFIGPLPPTEVAWGVDPSKGDVSKAWDVQLGVADEPAEVATLQQELGKDGLDGGLGVEGLDEKVSPEVASISLTVADPSLPDRAPDTLCPRRPPQAPLPLSLRVLPRVLPVRLPRVPGRGPPRPRRRGRPRRRPSRRRRGRRARGAAEERVLARRTVG